ncbi:MAG: hypothetical protein GVY26_16540 [Bacteroidetes bacterium]|jgi:Sec-independent protein secretion pathway component TatC|nr:hypothetical protein [Bacteroidota bacterium]
MNYKTAFKYLDVTVQVFLMATISMTIIYSAISGLTRYMALALFLAFPLGLWQVFSAIATSISRDSYEHGLYAFGAISYCLLAVGMAYLYGELEALLPLQGKSGLYLAGLFWLPPTVGAFWYLDRSFKDCQSQ